MLIDVTCPTPQKWSNTLKQFVVNNLRIVRVCLNIVWGCCCLKGQVLNLSKFCYSVNKILDQEVSG